MTDDMILRRISIRSDDYDKKRLCDFVLGKDGHLYLIDVENDQKRGKKKYIACIDAYVYQLLKTS